MAYKTNPGLLSTQQRSAGERLKTLGALLFLTIFLIEL